MNQVENHDKICWIKSKNLYLLNLWQWRQISKKHKKCLVKRNPKFENYKHLKQATQIGNKINCLAKNIDSLKKN